MLYYLKKCGFQELGSVQGGKAQRGRYLLTSKDERVLSFFPPLSTAQLNDSALIPVIPLYSMEKVYCNFVYHNDKYHGSTARHPRDEYRIYLNKALEQDALLFKTDDIVIIRKDTINEGGEQQTVFLLDLLSDHSSALYSLLRDTIENSDIYGGYGVYEGEIAEFERKAEQALGGKLLHPIVDKTVSSRVSQEEESKISALFNSASFSDFVMCGYQEKCAVTGTAIRCGNYSNLQAAHIKPKSHGGPFLPSNGIAMCRDMHWAFDTGCFTLNDHLEVVVHPRVESDYLHSLDGRRIFVPSDKFFAPNLEYVKYHRETVYGLFLTSGRL